MSNEKLYTQAEMEAAIAAAAGAQREADVQTFKTECKRRGIGGLVRGPIIDFIRSTPLVFPAETQAWLAKHDSEVFHMTLDAIAHDGSELVVGGKEPVRVFSERELGRIAQLEAALSRTRQDTKFSTGTEPRRSKYVVG